MAGFESGEGSEDELGQDLFDQPSDRQAAQEGDRAFAKRFALKQPLRSGWVAQVSKPAVSPISKSAGPDLSHARKLCSSASWKPCDTARLGNLRHFVRSWR